MSAPVKTGTLITKIVNKKTIVTSKKAVPKKTLDKAHDEVQNVKLKIGGVVTITEPQKIGLATLSSVTAEFSTYPLDFVKTRLQLQGTFAVNLNGSGSIASVNKSLSRMVFEELKNSKSLKPFYKGASPAILRHSIYSGIRMPLYEASRDSLKATNNTSDVTLTQAIVLAGASGAFSQWLITPTDLIKTRMQTGQASSIAKAAKFIFKSGIRNCWTGATPNVYRAIMTNQGDLMAYDRVKQHMIRSGYEDGFKARFAASFCAALVATVFSMPFDTIKIRLMSQCIANPSYSGVVNCGMMMVREEGFLSLYRGFLPAWTRQVIWSQVFWQTNENLRDYFGFKAF